MNGEADSLTTSGDALAIDRAGHELRSPLTSSVYPSRRVVWALAWPVIVAMLSESLVGLVDVLMVSRLGAPAVAGVGVGAQILSGVSVTMTAVGTGTLALVARYIGAHRPAQAERVLGQSVITAFGL